MIKFNSVRSSLAIFILVGAFSWYSCQENAQQDKDDNMSVDTTRSGLEGTRDQAGTVGGSDVIADTSSGQSSAGGDKGTASGAKTRSAETAKDQQFVSEEIAGNIGEIKIAKLAQQQSENKEIKSIATTLEKDHTAALDQLKSLASKKDLVPPTGETSEIGDKLKDLDGKKGTAFDKDWCETMMEKHKNAISKYENAAKDLADPELKKWINSRIPKLRMHHDKLMACHNKLKS